MKRFAILSILVLTFALGLAAAPPKNAAQTAEQKNEARLAQMQQRFNLTAEQTSELRRIFADEERQIQNIRARYKGQKGSADRAQLQAELKQVQQDTRAKMQEVVKQAKGNGKVAKPNKRAQRTPGQRRKQ